MEYRKLGKTGLDVAPIVFGGNVLGWTTDEKRSFEVLDAFFDSGFNAIDTADMYSAWAPGHHGGESESMIGRWLKARPGKRNHILIFTKVGGEMPLAGQKGLSRRWIERAVEDSLKRMGIDTIDLYFSHWPDPDTPNEETLGAYDALLRAGKIRAIGASNFSVAQLEESLQVAHREKLPAYQVLQPEYNLAKRDDYEGALSDFCVSRQIAVVTYFSLAAGFLTGKYRSQADLASNPARSLRVKAYLNPHGWAVLDALTQVADRHQAPCVEIALAWLMTRPGVVAPIASATSIQQVEHFARAAALELSAEDLNILDNAGTTA